MGSSLGLRLRSWSASLTTSIRTIGIVSSQRRGCPAPKRRFSVRCQKCRGRLRFSTIAGDDYANCRRPAPPALRTLPHRPTRARGQHRPRLSFRRQNFPGLVPGVRRNAPGHGPANTLKLRHLPGVGGPGPEGRAQAPGAGARHGQAHVSGTQILLPLPGAGGMVHGDAGPLGTVGCR